jgi:hypothetical protein
MAFVSCETRLRPRNQPRAGWYVAFATTTGNSQSPMKYQGLYAYDKTPLNAVLESGDDSSESWRMEKVSFDAAYGKERITAYLFLPKNSSPLFRR